MLPANRDVKQVLNTPVTLSDNVSRKGEMDGDRWKLVVGGICAISFFFFFFVTDNQRA